MSDVASNSISTAFKSLPASLLSPFEAALDGGGFGTGLFSNLLSEMSGAENAVTSSAPVTSTVNVATPINLHVSSVQTTVPYPDTTALRQVLQYIRTHGNAQQSSQTSQGNANNTNGAGVQNSTSSNVTPNTSSNTEATTTTVATQTASSTDNTNTSSSASASANDPNQPPDAQTISEALLELQQLVQWVAQKLSSSTPDAKLMASISAALSPLSASSASASASSQATSPTSASTVPTTGVPGTIVSTDAASVAQPTSASSTPDATAQGDATLLADTLVAFLALVHNAGALSTTPAITDSTLPVVNTAETANVTASGTTPTPANLSPNASLKATLQKLEAAIFANAANNAQTSDDTGAVSLTNTDNAASGASAALNPSSYAKSSTSGKTSSALTSDALLPEINLSAPTVANNLIRMIGDIFGNANAAAAASSAINGSSLTTDNGGAGSGFGSNTGQGDSNNPLATETAPILSANDDATPLLTNGAQAAINPFSFASQLSATHAASTAASSTGVPSVLDQVILSLSRATKNGDSQMTIQLQPADLGRINIKLDFSSDGKVQGTVVADNPATLDHLLKDVRSLERALQEAGLRADPGSLQFSLGGQQQPGNTFGQASNEGSSGGASSDTNSSAVSLSAADAVSIPVDTEIYYITPGGVNIKV